MNFLNMLSHTARHNILFYSKKISSAQNVGKTFFYHQMLFEYKSLLVLLLKPVELHVERQKKQNQPSCTLKREKQCANNTADNVKM